MTQITSNVDVQGMLSIDFVIGDATKSCFFVGPIILDAFENVFFPNNGSFNDPFDFSPFCFWLDQSTTSGGANPTTSFQAITQIPTVNNNEQVSLGFINPDISIFHSVNIHSASMTRVDRNNNGSNVSQFFDINTAIVTVVPETPSDTITGLLQNINDTPELLYTAKSNNSTNDLYFEFSVKFSFSLKNNPNQIMWGKVDPLVKITTGG